MSAIEGSERISTVEVRMKLLKAIELEGLEVYEECYLIAKLSNGKQYRVSKGKEGAEINDITGGKVEDKLLGTEFSSHTLPNLDTLKRFAEDYF